MGNAAVPSMTILSDALPALRVNVKALDGSLRGVLEAFVLAALGRHSCQKLAIE